MAALLRIGWTEKRNPVPGRGKGVVRRGVGMASTLWFQMGRPGAEVDVTIRKDGRVLIENGGLSVTMTDRNVFVRMPNGLVSADYIERITAGMPVIAERRALTATEHVEEALFTGLRLTAGLDLAAIAARHGVDVWRRHGAELAPLVTAGLLVHEPDRRLALTRAGMLLANEVMAVFIGPTVR